VSLTSPVRTPDVNNTSVMTRRAWILLVLTLVVPGSVQLLAGNRRLGRFIIGTWLSVIAIALIGWAVLTFFAAAVITAVTSWIGLLTIQIALGFLALTWLVAAVDTFRLIRFAYVGPRAKAWVAVAALIAIVVPTGVAAYGSYLAGVSRSAFASIFGDAPAVQPINGLYTFMLVGGDAGADRIGMRTDSMRFVTVDSTSGQVTIVGLPRNLYNAPFVEGSPMLRDWPNGFNCGDNCLLAYVYTYAEDNPNLYRSIDKSVTTAGMEALRDSVEAIVGMPVQYYLAVDMQGFQELIDALGGIDITLDAKVNFCEIGQPVEYTFPAGAQHLDGFRALQFARTRCDTDDYDRMKHQHQIEEAIFTQISPSVILARFQDLANATSGMVKTDIPQSMVGIYLDLAQKSRELPIQRGDLIPPEFDYLYPDWAAAQRLVSGFIYPNGTPEQ